jgi:hypothetical protein
MYLELLLIGPVFVSTSFETENSNDITINKKNTGIYITQTFPELYQWYVHLFMQSTSPK